MNYSKLKKAIIILIILAIFVLIVLVSKNFSADEKIENPDEGSNNLMSTTKESNFC